MSSVVVIRSCVRARLALSLALDGEAEGPDLFLTAMHLGRCGSCREFAARLGAITAELRAAALRRPGEAMYERRVR